FSENSENTFIEIECNGIFGFKENTTFEQIPDFFYNNSMAILFPYLRAFISLVTLQINIPPLILPTLNLSSLEADLRKNTFNI
ncbi:protein-export chaperone SecB, partial [Aquirufa beregesia]